MFANVKTLRTTVSNHTVNRHKISRESQRGSSNFKIVIQSRHHQKQPSRDVPRERCWIFSEHLFLKTPLDSCFCSIKKDDVKIHAEISANAFSLDERDLSSSLLWSSSFINASLSFYVLWRLFQLHLRCPPFQYSKMRENSHAFLF